MNVPRTPAARAYLKATDVLTSYRCGAIHERDALDMLVEAGQSRIEAQKKRVRELSELLKIPVFGIWGGAKDFSKDKIHMRSYSEAGKPLVQRLLAELGLPYDAAVAAMLGKEQSGGSSYTGATGAAPSMPAPAAATPASAGMPMGLFIGLVAAAGLAAFFFLRRKKQGD